ncbi:MAG: N-acetylmuramoyl-L-alanine amidase [Lachnospiraceae bacterium]|nr:N-acetylmuramoyl-L-alanine amidase [Lachnospiraceae bacterium]
MNQKRYNQIRRRRKRIIKRIAFAANFMVMAIMVILLVYLGNEKSSKSGMGSSRISEENVNIENSQKTVEQQSIISPEQVSEFARPFLDKMDKCKKYVVCLDAGHGGDDVGAEGRSGQYEKEETLKLALMVKEYLESAGVTVVMTRKTDKKVSLAERREIAENCNADLLLSLHRNIYEGTEDVNGIEAWINNSRPADAKKISERILNCVEQEVPGVKNRGVKWGTMDNVNENYGVNKVSMASLILETGFMSSVRDSKLFEDYLDEYAKGIAKGVLESI